MVSTNEIQSIGFGTALVLLNIGLMSALSFTPAANLLGFLSGIHTFAVMIVYGALLTGGRALAESGLDDGNIGLGALGALLLMFAYSTFGAGLLKGVAIDTQMIVLGITAGITTLIAVAAGALVYGTNRDFSKWQMYSFGFFITGIVSGAIGIFFPLIFLLTFVLITLGFTAMLVYEIWDMKAQNNNAWLNAIGLYTAYIGVFVQILQIVLRLLKAVYE